MVVDVVTKEVVVVLVVVVDVVKVEVVKDIQVTFVKTEATENAVKLSRCP